MDVQYQSWGDHLTKFDAALAGGTAPDVIELGNTETTRYMASRLLRGPDDSDKELPELQDVAEGAQGLVYLQRAPLLRAVLRGRTRRHLSEGPVQGRRHQVDAEEPRRVPGRAEADEEVRQAAELLGATLGRYIWASMAFVYDYGGKIAEFKNGKWKGTLDSPQAIQGADEAEGDRRGPLPGEQDR